METTDRFRHEKRNVLILACCQALLMTTNTIMWSTGPLVGLEIAPLAWLATIPTGLTVLFNAIASMPASNLMQKFGRKRGFVLAGVIGVIGASLIVSAIFLHSFAVLVLGNIVVGVYLAFGIKYRFAAVDEANPLFKSKAMSLVLAGGVVAPFAGGFLADLTVGTFAPIYFAGCYVATAACYGATALLVLGLRVPKESHAESRGVGRPLREIARQESFVVAVLGGVVAWLVLQVPTIGGSLAMKQQGLPFRDIALVVTWRMVAMFAPSFFTGALMQRLGAVKTILAGAGLLTIALVTLLRGISLPFMWTGMILLGVGWNMLFLGSSRLLVDTHEANEKGTAQGFFDAAAFGVSAAAVLGTGAMFQALGWQLLNGLLIIPCVACVVLTLRLARHRARESTPG